MKSTKHTLFGALLFAVFFSVVNVVMLNEVSGKDIGLYFILGFGVGLLVFGLVPWMYQNRK